MNNATRTAVAAALTLGLTGWSFAQNQPQEEKAAKKQTPAQTATPSEAEQPKAQKQRQNRPAKQPKQNQQEAQQQQQPQTSAAPAAQLKVERAGELLEFDVYNMQGQKLGAIEDIVLDARTAEVAYIVLEHDDPVFDKHYAVPLAMVKIGRADGERVAVIDVPAAAMRQAPAFDESNAEAWPERANPFFAQFMQGRARADFQERTPEQPADRDRFAIQDVDENDAWEIDRWFSFHDRMETRRLSQVIGMDVENVGGNDLGEIEDVAIDMRTGRVAYAVISYGGTLNVGQEMAAVPWNAMKPRLDDDEFVLNTDRKDLTQFRIGPNENLASVDFGRRLHERFNLEPYWIGTYGFAGDSDFDGGGAWSAQSQFNQQYDPQKTQTIQGELVSVGSFRPASGAEEGMRLRIRTQDDKLITVYAGPTWFTRQREFDLDRGDQVTIVGSQATVDNRQVILAQQVKADDQTLQLRDDEGKPQWHNEQRERYSYEQQQRRQPQGRDVYGTDRQDDARQRQMQQQYERQRETNQRYEPQDYERQRDQQQRDDDRPRPQSPQRPWYEESQNDSRGRDVPQSGSDYERQRMQQYDQQRAFQQRDEQNQRR